MGKEDRTSQMYRDRKGLEGEGGIGLLTCCIIPTCCENSLFKPHWGGWGEAKSNTHKIRFLKGRYVKKFEDCNERNDTPHFKILKIGQITKRPNTTKRPNIMQPNYMEKSRIIKLQSLKVQHCIAQRT